jgi:hypothetical protein
MDTSTQHWQVFLHPASPANVEQDTEMHVRCQLGVGIFHKHQSGNNSTYNLDFF